ncbi:MAG: hypothetical protein RR255_00175 [Bacilli bacterium]
MGKYGLEIKNIKAGTLYGYNNGVRTRYESNRAMFNNSLFNNYICKNGLSVYKDKSTRDIICLDFDFGSFSYEEEKDRLEEKLNYADDESKQRIIDLLEKIDINKDKYIKKSKEEIRDDYYENGVTIRYQQKDKLENIVKEDDIDYKMLYRSPAKAKLGQAIFINKKLYNKAYNWLTMGLGNKMPKDNAKIVEMSAYAPLTTSTIVDTIHIPIEDIVILKDQESIFKTLANVVKAEIVNGNKKCVVAKEETSVVNTMWDGMALIEESYIPKNIEMNGMLLVRNHFFKSCGVKSKIQLFLRDWCRNNNIDFDTFEIEDMFGIKHKAKDIKMVTTDNSIKWKKFSNLMGNNDLEAYQYWCNKINEDGSIFGIVKTDHSSKMGNSQQMSYQMVNTLPCTFEEVGDIAKQSIDYVELIKSDDDEFEKFLRDNKNEINHYEMLADLYKQNKLFAKCEWFRVEKKKIIFAYVERLRKGKIFVRGDNLTIFGNPYGLLLHCVGENYENDKTLQQENDCIQCYTKQFKDGEYLSAFRNPHNSPNNIAYLHNVYSDEMEKYFSFSDNIIAVNCIHTDIQDRANSMDFDSDFMFVTNQKTTVKCAKECYKDYPTIVNALKESGVTYHNTKKSYSDMDNKFSNSRIGIGVSSNQAQLALTYYWTELSKQNPNKEILKELNDNFVILSVLAQVIIDGCKREYEIDALKEIERIQNMRCMQIKKTTKLKCGKSKTINYNLPNFMKYTKEIKYTKNGKDIEIEKIQSDKKRITDRINPSLICPMNYLEKHLDSIKQMDKTDCLETKDFFIKMSGDGNRRQISNIVRLINEYDSATKHLIISDKMIEGEIVGKTEELINEVSKIKIGNIITINRLIETALNLELKNNSGKNNSKYCRKLLNILYRTNKEKFLICFKIGEN